MKKNNEEFKKKLKTRVYIFSLRIIKLVEFLDGKGLSSQILARQIMRSGTSIGANIVEAQAGRTRRDFTNFICHALKSANETRFWLGLIRDSGKFTGREINLLLKETNELCKILSSSILTLKGKKKL